MQVSANLGGYVNPTTPKLASCHQIQRCLYILSSTLNAQLMHDSSIISNQEATEKYQKWIDRAYANGQNPAHCFAIKSEHKRRFFAMQRLTN